MTEFCQIKDPHYNFCSEDSHFKERKHQISSLQYSIYTVFRTKDVGLTTPKYQKLYFNSRIQEFNKIMKT